MIYKKVGAFEVSNVVLGGANFGSVIDEKNSFALMDTFVDRGGNCIDTARLYGFTGKSEACIGRWLAANPDKREKLVISTKGGHPELKTMDVSRLGKKELESDLDESLSALGVDCIDIYWLHRDDEAILAGEIIETLNGFIRKGKIKSIGASNWKSSRVIEANRYAKEKGLSPFVATQVQWSLAHINEGTYDPTTTAMTDEEYEVYSKTELSAFAFSSQAMGIFSLLEKGGEEALTGAVRKFYLNDITLKRYDRALSLAKKYGMPISSVIMSYVYSDYNISAHVLIGPNNTELLLDSITNPNLILTSEEIMWLKNG